ncbi:aspartic proteinase [Metarhizium album ARSEF 1941]|uniref:Aspartic proteinase n=1 Tax=Metarhizium album (strain ARSEF 1941) TaxID=1081103 RepID=A0A0B2X1X0_METAS|nr:aspartic proteinase [Metarhizium album ARSEF 1941]KHN99727.1 aspartic proteinase [Metarhizium album ARSEF 1941]
MKATLAAVVLAILADGAAVGERTNAAPQEGAPRTNGTSFSLNQVRNQDFQGHNGAVAFLRAHFKYADSLPDHLSKLVQDTPDFRLKAGWSGQGGQTGSVLASPSFLVDTEYSVIVKIGSPPQKIPMNLDTGSSDFWVFSTETDKALVRGQVLYDANRSFTSHFLTGQSWKIKYGDNTTASGYVYTDRVEIGGTHVNAQAVQVAVNVSKALTKDDFVCGILGMANSAANTVRPTRQLTYIDNIKNDLARPLFTADLRSQAPGTYNFGFIDHSAYIDDIAYTPIERSFPLWMIKTTGHKVGTYHGNEAVEAIVDTGTSLLLLPESVVSSYYARVPGSSVDPFLGMVVVPCNAKLPDFYLKIGSYRGRVPGSYMNYGPLDPQRCYGGLQSSRALPFSVIGDVFLKAQFAVFDYGNARVGFANKRLYV